VSDRRDGARRGRAFAVVRRPTSPFYRAPEALPRCEGHLSVPRRRETHAQNGEAVGGPLPVLPAGLGTRVAPASPERCPAMDGPPATASILSPAAGRGDCAGRVTPRSGASAGALLAEMARRGHDPGHVLDNALLVASTGFADLDRATLRELGERFAISWSARSGSERGVIQAYVRYARGGEPLSPEAIAAGRTPVAHRLPAVHHPRRERARASGATVARRRDPTR
jgi:hypothetical protein